MEKQDVVWKCLTGRGTIANCSTVLAIRRRLLILAARVQSQVGSCGIAMDPVTLWQVISVYTRFPYHFSFHQIHHFSHLLSVYSTIPHLQLKYEGAQSHPTLKIMKSRWRIKWRGKLWYLFREKRNKINNKIINSVAVVRKRTIRPSDRRLSAKWNMITEYIYTVYIDIYTYLCECVYISCCEREM
jgi:hypothetical protein